MDSTTCVIYSGIIISGLELLTSFHKEVNYVWRTWEKFSMTRMLYLYARYYIFVLLYLTLLNETFMKSSSRSLKQMEDWRLYKTFSTVVLKWCMNYPFMKTIHGLFGRSRIVATVLISLGTVSLILDVTLTLVGRAMRLNGDVEEDSTFEMPHIVAMVYGYTEAVFQLILLCIVVLGRKRAEYMRTPLITRILRTGTMFTMSSAVILVGTYFQITDFEKRLFPIGMILFSSVACRYILAMLQGSVRKKRSTFDHLASESLDEEDDLNIDSSDHAYG